MINIGQALRSNSRLEAELLLGHILNKSRAYLFAHPEQVLTAQQWETFHHLMAEHTKGIPLAYLTGRREFWSLDLKVNKHTLIPRHETERLVEVALELLPDEPLSLLELGTGSGAIALALAKERPHWQIIASDISKEALDTAKENKAAHKLNNISFYQSDWYQHIPQGPYHAIIANPPYIAAQDPHLQEGDLPFEPHHALVSGQDGLADLQCIIEQSPEYLLPKGLILLEHGYDQKAKVSAILNELGYKKIQCWQDLQGHDRVSGGWRPNTASAV